MRINLVLLLTLACDSTAADPIETVTYSADLLPILEAHCIDCHSDEGIAPFALDTFDAVRAWGSQIEHVTHEREMPPFNADNSGACGTYQTDEWLSDDQLDTIARWVEGGMEAGDSTAVGRAPAAATLQGEIYLAMMAEPYVPLGQESLDGDELRCFRIGSLDEDAFVTGFDFVPGNEKLVHHALLYAVDPTAAAIGPGGPMGTNADLIAQLEGEDDRPGWDCFFGAGGVNGAILGIWSPGQPPIHYPNAGIEMRAGWEVVIEMHYFQPNGVASDQTGVRLEVASSVARTARYYLEDGMVESLFFGSPAQLAPGQASVEFSWDTSLEDIVTAGPPGSFMGELPEAIEMIGVFPHMHLTGRRITASIERGGESTCIADVPRYDFDWQRLYLYESPLRLTAEDQIGVRCEYDTSARTEPTSAGFASLDEMCSFIILGVEE